MGGTSPETTDPSARAERSSLAWRRIFEPPFGEIVCLLGVGVLLGLPLAKAGLWEVGELDNLEFARKIMEGLFSGAGSDAPTALPSLRELGRGELPFLGTALAFSLLGANHLVARGVCLGFSLLTVLALHLLVRRMVGRQVACLSSVLLATTPLFFWQARTALLDAGTMACLAWAITGFSLAVAEPGSVGDSGRRPLSRSILFLVIGLLAAGLGILCRGVWLGAVVPLLAVGVVSRTCRTTDAWRRWLGVVLLWLGVLGLALGLVVLFGRAHPPEGTVSRLFGGVLRPATRVYSFDSGIPELLFGTFPHTGLFAVALLQPFFVCRREGTEQTERRRTLGLLFALVAGASYVFTQFGRPFFAAPVFPAVFALAGLAALALSSFERARRFPLAVLMVALALNVLVHADLEHEPSRLMLATGVGGVAWPSAVVAWQLPLMRVMTGSVLLGGLLLACVVWLGAREPSFAPMPRVRAYFRGFIAGRHGLTFSVTLVVETALVTLAALALAQLLGADVPVLRGLTGAQLRGLSLLFLVPPALVLGLPVAVWCASAAARFEVWLTHRGWVVSSPFSLGMLAAGMLGFVIAQPRLIAELAPPPPLAELAALRKAGEPLGVFGVDPRQLGPQLARQVTRFSDPTRAVDFLLEEPGPRYMFVERSALGDLNAAYREHTQSGRNLPVVDANDGPIRLVTSALPPHRRSHNPLSEWIMERPVAPSRPLDAVLGGVVRVVGWELRDREKRPLAVLDRSRSPELCITYAVSQILIGEWETFVHIDGQGRRYNADHPTLSGVYPMRLWQPNDTIVDCVRLTLDQSYQPGTYQVFFGFFRGSQRLLVTSGAHEENRVRGGALVVR